MPEKTADVAIAWPEPRDKRDPFINALDEECRVRQISFRCIDEKTLARDARDLAAGRLKIRVLIDMASETFDTAHPFTQFVYRAKDSGARIIDDPDAVRSAADKSITHFDLVRSRVPVPATIVIRHWEPSRRLSAQERELLGTPFVIKPALGFGQQGVAIVRSKQTLAEIARARKFSPGDNFLLQEFITTRVIEGRPAWFRVYQLFGEIIPCWWNPETHEYTQVTLRQMDEHRLMPLMRIASEIGRITRVDWFSCEIAQCAKTKRFIAIDYMNDQCAIYPKSEHKDGVPDELISLLARRLIEKAWEHLRGQFTLAHRAIWFPRIKVKDENI